MASFNQFRFNCLLISMTTILLTACGGGSGADGNLTNNGGFTSTNNTKPQISSEASTAISSSSASINSVEASSNSDSVQTQSSNLSLSSSRSLTKSSAESSAKSSAKSSSSKAASSLSSTKATINLDTTPPTQPDNFTTQTVRHDIVILKWNDASDNVAVTFYNLYRDGVLLDKLLSTENIYYDYDVTSNRNYSYSITAGDAAGNWSALTLIDVKTPSLPFITNSASSIASASSITSASSISASSVNSISSASASSKVTTPDTTIPTSPSDILKLRAASNQVDISWTAATDNVGVTGYKVYRDGTLLKNVSADIFTYSDKTVAPDTSYWFGVSAGDAAGNWSSQKLLNIKTPPISSSGTATLQWEPPIQRENGTTLLPTEIGGYDVRYKSTQESSYHYLPVNKSERQITITNLTGENTFEIAVFDTNGRYSYFVTLEPK